MSLRGRELDGPNRFAVARKFGRAPTIGPNYAACAIHLRWHEAIDSYDRTFRLDGVRLLRRFVVLAMLLSVAASHGMENNLSARPNLLESKMRIGAVRKPGRHPKVVADECAEANVAGGMRQL